MDFENLQDMLDGIVKDKELGIINTVSPLQLSSEEFIGLLNSGLAYDFELNKQIDRKIKREGNTSKKWYYHTAKYRGVDFLTHGEKKITNEFGEIQPI